MWPHIDLVDHHGSQYQTAIVVPGRIGQLSPEQDPIRSMWEFLHMLCTTMVERKWVMTGLQLMIQLVVIPGTWPSLQRPVFALFSGQDFTLVNATTKLDKRHSAMRLPLF